MRGGGAMQRLWRLKTVAGIAACCAMVLAACSSGESKAQGVATSTTTTNASVHRGVTGTSGYLVYWDQNEGTRAFAKRFQPLHPNKAMPNDMHAGMYSATLHLMKAMAETKSADDGVKLIDTMKAMPTDDPLFGKGSIRIDGRKLHPVYLMTTKTLAESKGDWDYFKLVATIKPEDAWRPLDKGGCPFVKA